MEIRAQGTIPFVRFMELALYCPDCGFYDKESDTVGRRGNFYTSVSVGSLFGQLLAFQFAEWLLALNPQPSTFNLVEAGAHDGQLASDVLQWLSFQRPDVFESIKFWIIEPSDRLQSRQKETLRGFSRQIQWAKKISDIDPVTGIIYSNELLDAMPVKRFGWDARQQEWFEWGVTMEQDRFVWQHIDAADQARELLGSAGFQLEPQLLAVLPDGFTVEISPDAQTWWRDASNALQSGKLVTFDYGLNADETLLPQRKEGTLRAYYRHRLVGDVLANPGEQDITAHVNFAAIQSIGETVGLRTEMFQTQIRFLTDIVSRVWKAENGFGVWTGEKTRQFQTLTHPDHLGHSFRVLVQSR